MDSTTGNIEGQNYNQSAIVSGNKTIWFLARQKTQNADNQLHNFAALEQVLPGGHRSLGITTQK